MNVTELKESNRIIFETVSGSNAYGTNTPNSDIDIRGFYVNPPWDYLGLNEPANQISDEKHDTTYYSLKRAFELLTTANPNMIELLWMPEDCVKVMTPQMKVLLESRDLFISKRCFHTHNGYAFAQIKKAKGQNKKVHNPQPETMPVKEDYCRVISIENLQGYTEYSRAIYPRNEQNGWTYNGLYPFRPVPLKETKINLAHFHAASLEHAQNIYRLYYYGEKANGVFRGNGMLVCESIPKEDEWEKIAGLLIYDKGEYEKGCKDWHSYWDWKNNRNDARWIDQESGVLNYDAKNMMHCVRLLMSGENILQNGEPIVRFEGHDLEYLKNIRSSRLKYEDIMKDVERRMAVMQRLYDTTSAIPNKVNVKKLERLYRELAFR